MRKRILALFLILSLALGVTAQAVEVLSVRTVPKIAFDGTTATCTVSVRSDKATDTISLTAKLYQGSTCVKTWNTSGTGVVQLSKPVAVEKGKTYKLTADVTINGVKQATKSTTATCP